MHTPVVMYYFRLLRLPHRGAKGKGQPEHGHDKYDNQGALPPGRSGRIEARVLCEFAVLGYMPVANRGPLPVVVVGGEGLVLSRGHGC